MILVTGDVVLDHNVYAGRRKTPDSGAAVGMRLDAEPGGAMLTYGLLMALRSLPELPSPFEVAFGLRETTVEDLKKWPEEFQAGAVWDLFDGPAKETLHWKLSKNLGYGQRKGQEFPASPAPDLDDLSPRVVVIDDGGLGFRLRTASRCWPRFLRQPAGAAEPDWIILKMSRPLARGDLWRELAQTWKTKLIVLVGGDDLRREDVRVSRGLSWESTVEDLVTELHDNPAVSGLLQCRHLVVALGGDAALWLDGPETGLAGRLVFDRERGEGEWEEAQKDGGAFGSLSAVAAACAWRLAGGEPGQVLAGALKSGLSTARFLREWGHGPASQEEPAFPFEEAARKLLASKHDYAVCATPGFKSVRSGVPWTILSQSANSEAFPGPLFGPARRLALLGPASLENVPCARFGKLLTLDRREIESLRSLRQLLLSYRDGGPQKRPLSLAVFGPPGSGKSFGLKEIAKGVFGAENPLLEFNLSQFTKPEDLIGAYHQVRDAALGGKTPLVFWDEFDSGGYFWLQYLLAPMQDGVFQEGQLSHKIGKSVFVFAGGTSRDFAHFGPRPGLESEILGFVMAKGPDFRSRLAGFLDVLGPNCRQVFDPTADAADAADPWIDDATDLDYPVRRAILLRSMLGLVGAGENRPLEIDRGLLTALLETPRYRNGARSLENLLSRIKDRGGVPLGRAHLPPDNLLELYVEDVQGFHELIRRSYQFLAQAEKLAPALHQDWMDDLPPEKRQDPYDKPYEQLDPEGKATNIAAASRIPDILELAGFTLEPGEESEDEAAKIRGFLEQNLEFLAEAEHRGWADQKQTEGWTHASTRDNEKRTHPLLAPYSDLPEEEKEKDRRTIRNYPKYARAAGFRIVPKRGDPGKRGN